MPASAHDIHVDPLTKRQVRAAIVLFCLGGGLDLYDLFLLLFMAPALARVFFPGHNATLSLAAVYAAFAASVLMRPLGSALFGSLADTRGRKISMVITFVGSGVTTALMGALPTVEMIGVWAPILFLVLRLIQGVFGGGGIAATQIVGVESVTPRWRGAVSGGFGGLSSGIGALLASVTAFVASTLFPGPAFMRWGWRFMFFCGILAVAIAFYAVAEFSEPPSWRREQKRRASANSNVPSRPLRELFTKTYANAVGSTFLISVGCLGGYYLTSGFLPTFIRILDHRTLSRTSLVMIAATIAAVLAQTLVGEFSQHFGRIRTFRLVGVIGIICLPILFFALSRATTSFEIFLEAILVAFIGNMAIGPLAAFLAESFPVTVRATGAGMARNVGGAIGGLLPTFVTLLSVTDSAIPEVLAAFIIGTFLVYILGSVVGWRNSVRIEYSELK